MYLIATGGGTGGHVFPAIEVARIAQEQGCEVEYFGSLRGIEGKVSQSYGLPFQGFDAQPIYNLKSPGGLRTALLLVRSSGKVMKRFRERRPDAVLSTGGYSSGPIMSAAKRLGIPYVIHEANSVPGRSNSLFMSHAYKVAYSFKKTELSLKSFPSVRTGHPIRRELRALADAPQGERTKLLIAGGSQGATALNQVAPDLLGQVGTLDILHICGSSNYDSVRERLGKVEPPNYRLTGFLEPDPLGAEMARAKVFVGRSGSMLAEVAAFRIPSVLVPLPNSALNHQYFNAMEFAQMGAASLIEQQNLDAFNLATAVQLWYESPDRTSRAMQALADWDRPQAAKHLAEIWMEAAASKNG
jgi:UDP-N-acetylglucosamine--N-acetylmuramyl-(pentapeptide) pyrophosphoryl-undecaprenol N-acetylglucosamine transferase